MRSKLIPVILTAALTSVFTLFLAGQFSGHHDFSQARGKTSLPVNYVNYEGNVTASTPPADFQPAAEASVQAVVHIKTKTNGKQVVVRRPTIFGDIYQDMFQPPQMGAGSGVVISPDGYIVTNNHVVAGADVVTVTFNDRYTTDAKLVATDPATDIAVLKIEGENLPYMEYGNSDDVRLGQWVLAVGYPFTLDATVTAGIVSAKSRSLGINRSQSAAAIESFIQTDAAVNPGNSGGALVNTKGQLVGINAAIASPTGSFAGYSYAIPSNIVKKVVEDIVDYGAVQRAFLGISYIDIKNASPEQIKELQLDRNNGVYVANIFENGAAEKAGLKKGDFIVAVSGNQVNTAPELLEQIALYKPGDNVSITYVRDGKPVHTTVQLKNIDGNTTIIKNDARARVLGAKLRTLNNAELKQLNISGGVMVEEIEEGILSHQTGMKKGFVITKAGNKAVASVEELQNILAGASGNLRLTGIYPGHNGMFYYGIQLNE
ncbi:MAG: trypsin-like peptidase domain-containing protein [Chitinophagaceae bacterium]|nr:trypsin-like peptidase domain-containing protein [Chitinophagaceae bacterium]MCB9046900.1 trypsin-like peptidase domain-containing protein [Chitinophagales bacterium]